MASLGLDSIAMRLGVDPASIAALDALQESDLARLESAIATAMDRDDRALDEGMEQALRFVPRPLRGVATRLLFGSGS